MALVKWLMGHLSQENCSTNSGNSPPSAGYGAGGWPSRRLLWIAPCSLGEEVLDALHHRLGFVRFGPHRPFLTQLGRSVRRSLHCSSKQDVSAWTMSLDPMRQSKPVHWTRDLDGAQNHIHHDC